MMRLGWLIAVVSACAMAVLWFASPRDREPPMASVPAAAPPTGAVHCASHSQATLRALAGGEQRLVVVVKAFEPPKAGGSGLVAWLLTANKTRRHELTRFAVHPLRAFTAQESRRSQRFALSLQEQGHLIEAGQPLCVEVGFDPAPGRLEGGRVEIDVELEPGAGAPPTPRR